MANEEDAAGNYSAAHGTSEGIQRSRALNGAAESISEPTSALTIEVALASKLSLADFQNAVPLLRELTLVSTLANDTGQVEVSLSSTPAFVKTKTWRIGSIKVGDQHRIRDVDVQLDGALLTRLTEAPSGPVVALTWSRAPVPVVAPAQNSCLLPIAGLFHCFKLVQYAIASGPRSTEFVHKTFVRLKTNVFL